MIEHQVQEPPRPVWQVLLLVVGMVLGVNAVVVWINRLPGGYGGLGGLLLILAMILYSSRLMNRKLARYTYRWDGSQLSVEKRIGRKDKPMIEIPGNQMEWIRPMEEVKGQLHQMKRVRKTLAFACRLKGEGVFMLQFVERKRTYRLIFQPGDTLAKALQKHIKKESR